MSIAMAIQNAQAKVAAAYTKCNDKGATMPQTQDLANLANTIDSIPTGQAREPEAKDVNFYDFDGERLYAFTKAEALALTELPSYGVEKEIANGATTLEFVEWNYTLAQIKADVLKRTVEVGAVVKPKDGRSWIRFKLVEPYSLEVKYRFGRAANGTIYWGDGTSSPTAQEVTHTYPSYGEYWLSFVCTSYADVDRYFLYFQDNSPNTPLVKNLKEAYFSDNIGYDYYGVQGMTGLEHSSIVAGLKSNSSLQNNAELTFFTLPKDAFSTAPSGIFRSCSKMRRVSIPSSLADLGASPFKDMAALESLSLPDNSTFTGDCQGCKSLTEIFNLGVFPATAFSGLQALERVTVADGVTTIPHDSFYTCPSLLFVALPASITSIERDSFISSSALRLKLLATTPPSVASRVFTTSAKIYVPQGYGETYKAATGWSGIASQIFELDQNGNIPNDE